jgi:hypothetical protein
MLVCVDYMLETSIVNDFNTPPLLCSGQSSCIQIQRSGLDSRRYQIFWEVVGLEQGPLSVVKITEKLFQGNGGSVALTTWHLLSAKLALNSPTSGGRSVGIVHLRTTDYEVCFVLYLSNGRLAKAITRRACVGKVIGTILGYKKFYHNWNSMDFLQANTGMSWNRPQPRHLLCMQFKVCSPT